MLVHLVDRPADEAELDDRAVRGDEAGVRCATTRIELGAQARDSFDRFAQNVS